MGLWDDMFGKKSVVQEIEDLLNSSAGSSIGATPGVVTGTTTGTVQLPSGTQNGGLIPSQLAGLTPGQLHQMISTLIVGLTKEEKAELTELKKEHEVKVKAAKLSIFKQLAADIRQLVINTYELKACYENMNSATVAKDPRLEALERKDLHGAMYGVGLNVKSGSGTSARLQADLFSLMNLNLPEGILLEDLKQAHMEATLEEEMLNNETNP